MFIDDSADLFNAFVSMHRAARDRGLLFNLNASDLQKIIDAYNEPWRRYHALPHIADGCRKLLCLWETMSDPVSTMFAWLHHDIVYLPEANGTNEECSAQFVEALRGKVDCGVIERAAAIIRSTDGHLLPDTFCGDTRDLALILDVDLSGFGDPHDMFVLNGELIQEENGQTPEEWAVCCAGFAKMLRSRPKLFKTKHFAHLEERAQENLKWAVEQAA